MYRNWLENLAKSYKKELKWKIKDLFGDHVLISGSIVIESEFNLR